MEFNDTTESVAERTETRNQAGGHAYSAHTPERQLYSVVVNNMLENNTYQSDMDALRNVQTAFDRCVSEGLYEFPLELAAYARNVMGNRDVAVLLYVMAANEDALTPEDPGEAVGVRDYGPRILKRMDEPMTALSIQDELFPSTTAPKALKKGISDAVNLMLEPDYESGAYRLQKYTQSNREVNIWNAVNRSHVRRYAGIPEEGSGSYKDELLTQLMEGYLPEHDAQPLPAAGTWEEIISEEGNTASAWRKALSGDVEGTSRGMGIMARVRNIRNMLDAGLSGEEIFGEDELERVRNSRMFPFRLFQGYQAYKELDAHDAHVEAFLEQAIQATVENVPDTWGNTAVGIDLSGSMDHTISGRSTMSCADLSTFFGGICVDKGAYACGFGQNMTEVDQPHTLTPALEIMNKILETRKNSINTGGTNAWLFMKHLNEMDRDFDRVVFLTDMQAWDDTRFVGGGGIGRNSPSGDEQTVKQWVDTYRDDPQDTAIYTIDLANYGDLMLPETHSNCYNISGWNEQILEYVEYAEEPGQIIDEVRGEN